MLALILAVRGVGKEHMIIWAGLGIINLRALLYYHHHIMCSIGLGRKSRNKLPRGICQEQNYQILMYILTQPTGRFCRPTFYVCRPLLLEYVC